MINEQNTDRDSYAETESLLNKSTDEGVNVLEEKGHSVGTKSLNTFYSIVFIINQIYGPGVLAIPAVFQQSGWLPTTIVLGVFLIVSCFSATLLCEALSLIPGNKRFDKHIEYTGAVKHYFGNRVNIVVQVLMNLCMQSYNIASIVVCAQSLDQFMMYVVGKTYALQLIPHPELMAVHNIDFLYNSTAICVSLGYIVITLFCLPAGFLNLEDNVKVVQLGSFVVLVVLMGEFCGQFFTMKFNWEHVPTVGKDFSQLVSIFIFSWAYVMFVPSWVNEKKNNVSTNKVIWICGVASFFGYLLIGMLAALVVPASGSDDLLKSLGSRAYPVVTIIASYIFSLGVIAPGIPVCCITTRYNLYIGKVCGKKMSYFWGVIAPWMVAFVFSQSTYFASFINWSSLIVNGVVNFLIPLALYWKAVTVKPVELVRDLEGSQQRTLLGLSGEFISESPDYMGDSKAHKADSLAYIRNSTVAPWPKILRRNAVQWTVLFFVVTAILILGQIAYALYLISQHKSPFG